MGKKEISEERRQMAQRLRRIRENAGLTQEKFAEVMGISVSAYKKLESGENRISLSGLKKLYEKMHVSADYMLYGTNKNVEEVWEAILNTSETEKMFLLTRLTVYFTKMKKEAFPLQEEQKKHDRRIAKFMKALQGYEEDTDLPE